MIWGPLLSTYCVPAVFTCSSAPLAIWGTRPIFQLRMGGSKRGSGLPTVQEGDRPRVLPAFALPLTCGCSPSCWMGLGRDSPLTRLWEWQGGTMWGDWAQHALATLGSLEDTVQRLTLNQP